MAWLEGEVGVAVRRSLDRMPGPVKLVFFTANLGCESCDDEAALLRELAAASDRLTLEVHNRHTEAELADRYGVDKVPALVLEGPAGARVRFYGIPLGYEFVSLLDGLHDAAAGSSGVSEASRAALADLRDPVHIQVFVTPTCPHCPGAVRTAHKLATAFPNITADMVEATEFPELSSRHGVQGVPHIVINGETAFTGNRPESAFVGAITAITGRAA